MTPHLEGIRVLSTFALATLLTLADPPGDAIGRGNLSAPTATAMRDREAFDILEVSVPKRETFGLMVGLGRAPEQFPQAVLEFYLSDSDAPAGTTALLPGSGMRLPAGQNWRYAVRIIGDSVQLFDGQSGTPVQINDAAGVRLEVDGTTLQLTTRLPLPDHFSLYGISGSYDPFSQTGWRSLREEASPWGYAGAQIYPVLDVVAESPALQSQSLEGGVLPEIRASFSENGWLLLSGAGVVLALGGLAARMAFGQRTLDTAGSQSETVLPAEPDVFLETPLAPFDVETQLGLLAAFQRGEAHLVANGPVSPPKPESVLN